MAGWPRNGAEHNGLAECVAVGQDGGAARVHWAAAAADNVEGLEHNSETSDQASWSSAESDRPGAVRLNAAQLEAIAARGDVLVAAGAGTGKTATLVARCVGLLVAGASIERILLVTFTEAAAFEMRLRLREALQARMETEAGGRAEHLEQQLALLAGAAIGTLHSYCLRLVREHYHESGVEPGVAVLDEGPALLLWNHSFEREVERELNSGGAAAAAMTRLLRCWGSGREPGLREVVLGIHRYSRSLPDARGWLEVQRRQFEEATAGRWVEFYERAVREWRNEFLGALKSLDAESAASGVVRGCLDCLLREESGSGRDAAESLVRSVAAVLEDEARWPKRGKGPLKKRLKGFMEATAFLASWVRLAGAGRSGARGAGSGGSENEDPLAADWEAMRGLAEGLVALVLRVDDAYAEAKRGAGGVDFSDLEQKALSLLVAPATGAPTALAMECRAGFDHVFVDECQDINAAQDAVIRAVSGPEGAGNRFLVGDVKQSIYRFRLAKPEIFRSYETRWRDAEPAACRIALRENFRSRPGVLNMVNALFRQVMTVESCGMEYEALMAGRGPAMTSDLRPLAAGDAGPDVELHWIERRERGAAADEDELDVALEARLVAQRLGALKSAGFPVRDRASGAVRPVRWNDMAVLLRAPGPRVDCFALEFARAGIPLVCGRGSGTAETSEAADLRCLLQILDNPMQDWPLLAVLRSPIGGLSPEDLARIRIHQRVGSFWEALLGFWRAGRRGSEATADRRGATDVGQQTRVGMEQDEGGAWTKVDRFVRGYQRWRRWARQGAVSECLEAVLAETHYEALLHVVSRAEQRVANVRHFVELARRFDPLQRQGLFRFLRHLASEEEAGGGIEAAPVVATDAVRLMSVHKSKGLEFPIVAVACLGATFNTRGLSARIFTDDALGLCPQVVSASGRAAYPSVASWLAVRNERRALAAEEMRLLYVALTRAGDRLILSGLKPRTEEVLHPVWRPPRAPADWIAEWLRAARASGQPVESWVNELTHARSALTGDAGGTTSPTTDDGWPTTGDGRRSSDAARGAGVASAEIGIEAGADRGALGELEQRLQWGYAHGAATAQVGKVTVTELRRAAVEGEDAVVWTGSNGGAGGSGARVSGQDPTGVEGGVATGEAVHRFMEWVDFARTTDEGLIRDELARLVASGRMDAAAAARVDVGDQVAFWLSALGCELRACIPAVLREVPFTFRMGVEDAVGLGLHLVPGLGAEEFVVVQGVADVVVRRPEGLWLLDYKTDAVGREAGDVEERAAHYAPQLRLYALALSRIYGCRVLRASLCFLRARRVVEVLAAPETGDGRRMRDDGALDGFRGYGGENAL